MQLLGRDEYLTETKTGQQYTAIVDIVAGSSFHTVTFEEWKRTVSVSVADGAHNNVLLSNGTPLTRVMHMDVWEDMEEQLWSQVVAFECMVVTIDGTKATQVLQSHVIGYTPVLRRLNGVFVGCAKEDVEDICKEEEE